tara:strand:+ start:256 stop:507 length:252 start_codon:yes stop_codon:yes gene_type:complete
MSYILIQLQPNNTHTTTCRNSKKEANWMPFGSIPRDRVPIPSARTENLTSASLAILVDQCSRPKVSRSSNILLLLSLPSKDLH